MQTADGAIFEKVFLGKCMGVGLRRRGENDPHVMVTLLTEDDESWFVSSGNNSSYWLPELLEVLAEARDWMDKHCEKGKWGWAFKKEGS